MLYLILSNNKEKIDKEVSKLAGKTAVLKMDAFSFDADTIRGKVGSFSLFGDSDESFMVLNQISESTENFEILKSLLFGISESTDKFAVVESEMAKEEIKFFEKAGATILDLEEKTATKSKWRSEAGKNPFAIADAVGKRSPKEAWIEYIKSREDGEPEEIHGRIIGKVRDILNANNMTAEESGMHPFVYRKAKMDMKNWKESDLKNFYTRLVALYHNSRMGGEELDIALEKELLTM